MDHTTAIICVTVIVVAIIVAITAFSIFRLKYKIGPSKPDIDLTRLQKVETDLKALTVKAGMRGFK